MTRKPERYSSAAPLTGDGRQRIVSELASLGDALTVTVYVGPPSPALPSDPAEWNARDLAQAVLIDKSTARISSGQRVSLNSLESAEEVQVDGAPYYYFESIARGSPTMLEATKETYRHQYAVSAVRKGDDGTPYIYTFSVQCPEALWRDGEAGFREAVRSFRLAGTTKDYVAPDRDPWRFF